MLTDRFTLALSMAEQLHRGQTRKGNDVPYVAHLLAVAASVLEWGGDEDTAIAALLHDAVEDQGGLEIAARIRAEFGADVADTVLHCSDSVTADGADKAPWFERKTAYLQRLRTADRAAAMVTLADKLHNIRATIRDLRRDGPETLSRFNEPAQLAWYYRSVVEALTESHADLPALAELAEAVAEYDELVASPSLARS